MGSGFVQPRGQNLGNKQRLIGQSWNERGVGLTPLSLESMLYIKSTLQSTTLHAFSMYIRRKGKLAVTLGK